MTVGEVVGEVRTLVNDTSEPYRFADATLCGFVLDAVRHMRNINPSEKYGEDGLLDDTIPDAALPNELRFRDRHKEAVVKYAAHLVYQLDMSDTVNLQIAETLRTRAETLMQL